jgi:LEA14-like dessication related protein
VAARTAFVAGSAPLDRRNGEVAFAAISGRSGVAGIPIRNAFSVRLTATGMVNLRSILFGSKLKVILTALLLLVSSVGGAYAAGVLGAPSVAGVENRFGDVTAKTTTIETDLTVNNPNPVGVRLGGTSVNYTVSMNDVSMANGTKEGLAIEKGNSTLHFTTTMRNERIPAWWVSHIRNGERTELEIDARIRSSLLGQSVTVPHEREIETDVIGQFNSTETRPVNASQPLVSDPILYINRTSASWGSVSQSETPIDMRFVVYNPKTTPYTISEIGYEITMNNITVGEGTSDDPYVIESRSEETIATATAIQNQKLDEWWVSHLERNQVTDLRIDFYARIELPSGDTVRVPLDELTYTKRIETDFFGTKGETAPGESSTNESSTDSEGTAEPSSTETSTPDDSETPTPDGDDGTTTTSTPTETATETTSTSTETTTSSETTTDDGILDLRPPRSQ